MSVYSLEQALYDFGTDGKKRRGFLDDPEAALRAYQLTAEESKLVRDFDVKAMVALGVNPMLTMGFWATTEKSRSLDNYVAALRK